MINRKIFGILCSAVVLVACPSCIKDEPLNAECDIERVSVKVDAPGAFFFHEADGEREVLSTDSVITFNVRSHADLTSLAPQLRITPGATVVPASGTTHDFSHGPVLYTVTSQDGRWSRRYWIGFTPVMTVVNDTLFLDFENYELEPKKNAYYIWHADKGGEMLHDWVSGNAGFQLAKSKAAPMDYPTFPEVNGYEGAALHLYTRDTGALGRTMKKPIAAGNFFLGEFDLSVAVGAPLKATRFGKPFNLKPVRMTGVYKYHPGEVFTDKAGNPDPSRTDEGSIYAVLYRNHDADGNPVMLFGDDVQTNPNIVALAKVKNVHATNDWLAWEAVFDYHSEIDRDVLENMGYSLTIVFSSSIDGDMFQGAIGSELLVDKVRLICTHEE